MKTVSVPFVILLVSLLLVGVSFGHEDEPSEFDIHLTPQQAFQNDELAIEASIERNGTPVSSLEISFVVDKHDIGLSERLEAKEREPGHYVMKYAFKNSGEHEVHVEFLDEGVQIRRTFNISVSGKSVEVENYFLVAALLVAAAAALRGMHSKNKRRVAAIAAVLLALTGLSYSVYNVYSSGAAQRGVTVCVSAAECYWSAHIHAQVDVAVCGEDFIFPIEKGRLDGPHTHEEKNLIHFHERLPISPETKEIMDKSPLTLASFFKAMEMNFSSDGVLGKRNSDLCNGIPGTVKMLVNGRPSSAFGDYVWKDSDKIEIVFDERPSETAAKEEQSSSAIAPEITLPIIIGFALIDSINPCVIGVLLLLLTILLKAKKRRAVLVNGAVYTLGVYVTYLLGGVTLLSIFNAVREIQIISQMFYVVIGAFVLAAAFLEIKDYFWYGRWFSLAIPKRFVKHVEASAKGAHASLVSMFVFGSLVTLVELPCTGAPYLAIITMLSQSGTQFVGALSLLLLYNLVFVLPLIVIIYLAYKGVGYKKMEFWRREHRGRMRLTVGLMLLGIGIWIITTIADWTLPYLIGGGAFAIALMYVGSRIGHSHHRSGKKAINRKVLAATFLIIAAAFAYLSIPKNVNVDIIDPPPWYAPAVLEIEPGTTVTWHLKSPAVHPVMSLEEPKGVGEIHSGHFTDKWSYKFDKPGVYVYICPIHPYMKGVIGVGQKVPKEKIPPWVEWPPEYKAPPAGKPAIPGEGMIWMTAQFHMVEGKEKPGTVIVINAETWEMEKVIADKRINNPHNIWDIGNNKMMITNWFDKYASTIDKTTGKLEKHILLGESPAHVMSHGDKVYVTLQGDDGVAILNATDFRLIKKERAPKGPHGHWFGGGLMALASTEKGKISVWNATTDKIIFEEFLGGEMIGGGAEMHAHSLPLMAGIMTDGKYAFAATSNTGNFYIFDITKKELVKSYPIGKSPIQVVPSPDGKYVVVPLTGDSAAAVVSTESWEIVKKIPSVGFGAHGVAYGLKKGGGYYAYITNKFATWVTVIDMSTLEIAGYIPLPKDTWGGQGIVVVQ